MTIDNLYEQVCSVSTIKHAPNTGLLAKLQVVCNFITDVGLLEGSVADAQDGKPQTARSHAKAPPSVRSRMSVSSVKSHQ